LCVKKNLVCVLSFVPAILSFNATFFLISGLNPNILLFGVGVCDLFIFMGGCVLWCVRYFGSKLSRAKLKSQAADGSGEALEWAVS